MYDLSVRTFGLNIQEIIKSTRNWDQTEVIVKEIPYENTSRFDVMTSYNVIRNIKYVIHKLTLK